MRSNRMFWAIFLVGAGFLFLADSLGIVRINVWNLIWPAFLILLGIWFLVGNSLGNQDIDMELGSVDLGDAESASIVVKHGAGRLSLDSSAEAGKLVSGSFATGLKAQVEKDGTRLKVVLEPRIRGFSEMGFPGNWIAGKGIRWDFGLAKDIPLDLVFEIGAVDAYLDLTDLLVKNLVLETGVSSTDLKLPAAAGTTHLKVEAGVASVVIHVPANVSARVKAEAGLASVSVNKERFPKQNGIYQSSDYETAENKVDIQIETGVASIEVR